MPQEKRQIRAKAMSYSKYIAKKTKTREVQAHNKLELLEKQIVDQPQLPEYYEISEGIISEGIIMRSKCVVEGEKITKYFLNVEKKSIT